MPTEPIPVGPQAITAVGTASGARTAAGEAGVPGCQREAAKVTEFNRQHQNPLTDVSLGDNTRRRVANTLGYTFLQTNRSDRDVPDTLIFSSRYYNASKRMDDWQKKYDAARGNPGEQARLNAEKPVITSSELGAAYLALNAELRAGLAYVLKDINRNDPDWRQKFREQFHGDFGFIQRMADRLISPDYQEMVDDFGPKLVTEAITSYGYDQMTREALEQRIKEVDGTIDDLLEDMMGGLRDNKNPLRALKNLHRDVLGSNENVDNKVHTFIKNEIYGGVRGDTDRRGILDDEKYYKGKKKWADLSPAEKKQVYDKLPGQQRNAVLYEAMERAAGDWANDMVLELQGEMREGTFQGEIDVAKQTLAGLKVTDKSDIAFKKSQAQTAYDGLLSESNSVQKEIAKLKGDTTGIAEAQSQAQAAREKKLQAQRDGTYADAKAAFESADSDLKQKRTAQDDAIKDIPGMIKATESQRDKDLAAVDPTKVSNADEIKTGIRNQAKEDIEKLEKARQKAIDNYDAALKTFKEAKAKFVYDDDINAAKNEIERRNRRLKELEAKIGDINMSGSLLWRLNEAKANLDGLIEAESAKGGELTIEAIGAQGAIESTLVDNYTAIQQAVHRLGAEQLSDAEIDASTGLCYGVQVLRETVGRQNKKGLEENKPALGYDPIVAEMRMTDYDVLLGYIKEFNLQIDLSGNDALIRLKTASLNTALRNWYKTDKKREKLPDAVKNARVVLQGELKDIREKVLAEISRHNKWEISEAVRLMLRDQVVKAGSTGGSEIFKPKRLRKYDFDAITSPNEFYEGQEIPQGVAPKIEEALRNDGIALASRSVARYVNVASYDDRYESLWVVSHEKPGDPKGTIVQDLRYADGRVAEIETGELLEAVQVQMAVDVVDQSIQESSSGEYKETGMPGGDRVFKRDATGRIVETEGLEKGKYLDELVHQNAAFFDYYRMSGEASMELLNIQIQVYRDQVQNKIGEKDSKASIMKSDEIRWASTEAPDAYIEMHLAEGGARGIAGTGVARVPITLRLKNIHTGAAGPVPAEFKNFEDFDQYMERLPQDVVDYFYAAVSDAYLDAGQAGRLAVGGKVEGFEYEMEDGTTYLIEPNDRTGSFRRKKIAKGVGGKPQTIAPADQVWEDDIVQAFNTDMQNDPKYLKNILAQKREIGRAVMEAVVTENLTSGIDLKGSLQAADRRVYRAHR